MSDARRPRARDWALRRPPARAPPRPHARLGRRAATRGASEALRIAAVTHDIERAFPDPDATWDSARDWDSRRVQPLAPGPLRRPWSPRWLREQDADPALVARRRGARPRARGRRLARGRRAAGGRLALVPGDDGPARARLGRARLRRQRGGEAAPLARPGSPPARSGRARAAAPLVERALAQLGAERGIVRHGTPAAAAARRRREQVLAATALVRSGRVFRLARERFPGMPLFPGHPPFQVLSYRTPQGIRAAGDQPWGPVQRRGARLHERARARQPAHRRAHRRARAHDGRRRTTAGTAARRGTQLGDFGPLPATPRRSRRCGGAACSTTCPGSAASTRSRPASR